jgi:hypothetical protein
VRIEGSCASGEMVSLSREDCRAEAETDVEVILVKSVEDWNSKGVNVDLSQVLSITCKDDVTVFL